MLAAEIEVTAEYAPWWQELCHDMRQPVASVFALAAAALAEPGLPAAASARMEEIIEQAEWLAKLIQHALHSAASDATYDNLSDLLEVAHEAVAAECMTWPGQVTVVGTAAPVLISVEPVQLHRMIANLLGNAMRAAGPDGQVTVTFAREDGTARLCIEDTGPGFGKIKRGLGLGLAAVQREASRHGGRLDCGDAEGGGARVCLTLPLAAAQGSGASPGPAIPSG